jgi:manganese/zinc/iron transport system permease protein
MLVMPTAAARQLTDRLVVLLPTAALLGLGVGVTGALLSAEASLPTGPVIVLVGTVVVLACLLLAPGRGVAWTARRHARERRRARFDGVLQDLETALHAGPPPTAAELAELTGRPPRALRGALRDLDRAGHLARAGDRLLLTEAGAAAAHAADEARRLWSLWLEHGYRLELPDAREPDPRDLRGSLGDDAVARLETLAATT